MKKAQTKNQLAAFGEWLREQEKSELTVSKYLHDAGCFLRYLAGEKPSRSTVLAYKAQLGERYAVSSANSMIAALNAFLRFCGRGELCVRQFRVQRQAYCSEQKELSREEYLRLIGAAGRSKNERMQLILQTICATGIRVSELRHITVEAVERGEAVVRCKGKDRRIFIIPALKRKLLRYIRELRLQSGEVFVSKQKKPLHRTEIWREMKRLCHAAGVAPEKVFPHNLRHLFARTFYQMEKDIAKLADLLGHASINTTRIYVVTTGAEHRRKLEHMRLVT